VLKQVEAGRTVKEVAGVGRQRGDDLHWKSKYGGMEVNEARRLKELEDENAPEAHGRRPQAGPGGAEGCDPKKRLSCSLRQDVALVMSEFSIRTPSLQARIHDRHVPVSAASGSNAELRGKLIAWRGRNALTVTGVVRAAGAQRMPAARNGISALQRRNLRYEG